MKNPMFHFGDKKAALVLAATALVAAGCGLQQPANDNSQQPTQEQSNSTAPNSDNSASTQTTNPAGSTWQGALELSDNTASGNYTITVNDHKIYLKTSRDFSKLLDKQVNVSYSGSLTNFVLNDITAQ